MYWIFLEVEIKCFFIWTMGFFFLNPSLISDFIAISLVKSHLGDLVACFRKIWICQKGCKICQKGGPEAII